MARKHKDTGKYTLAEVEELLKRHPLAWDTHDSLRKLKEFVERHNKIYGGTPCHQRSTKVKFCVGS
jgi:hypothetical protein